MVSLDSDEFVLGRLRTADLVLDEEKASRLHCRLTRLANGDYQLDDLGSTNGTRVDGTTVSGPMTLIGGERIRIGRHTITLSRTEPGVGHVTVIAAAAAATVGVAIVNRGSSTLSTQQIIGRAKASTVSVESDVDGQLRGRGTGWVLDAKRGLIVTNHHVVNAGSSFTVGLDGGKRPATIVGSSPCEDLSVLKVNDVSGLATMPLASQSDIKQGDKVVALGYPGNAGPKPELQANAGIVSVVRSEFTATALDVPKLPNILQTDAAINPGNSGGPLLDTKARLVGVNSAGDSSRENQAFAIGVDRVKEITAQLAEGGSRGWTGLGLVFPSSETDFTDLDLPVVDGGIVAQFAVPLTPAANLGLGRSQFVIAGINGNRLDGTLQSYCAQVATLRAGDKATFDITLDGSEVLSVPIKFA